MNRLRRRERLHRELPGCLCLRGIRCTVLMGRCRGCGGKRPTELRGLRLRVMTTIKNKTGCGRRCDIDMGDGTCTTVLVLHCRLDCLACSRVRMRIGRVVHGWFVTRCLYGDSSRSRLERGSRTSEVIQLEISGGRVAEHAIERDAGRMTRRFLRCDKLQKCRAEEIAGGGLCSSEAQDCL